MKEYKIGEIFQWEDRTLMCVEGNTMCEKCVFYSNEHCNDMRCGEYIYFTNKLIFSAEGLTLQIKRKGCKVKVKVLELGEEFTRLENVGFEIFQAYVVTMVYEWELGVYEVGDKTSHVFPTEQEAIEWVDGLFSLRGE